jgi:drug/metabolite transporter (DMT)-like permease
MERTQKTRTWVALWTVYILWGSTYFAIAIAIKSMPSLLAMGFRFLQASLILGLFLLLRKGMTPFRIPRKEILNAGLFGAMRLAIGLGATALAEHTVPSGVAALICSGLPLWISLFRAISGDRPAALSSFGIAIGFIGVAILLKPGQVTAVAHSNSGKLWFWMAVILFGNFAWALGTFFAPRFPTPKNTFISTFYEMLFAGFILAIVGLISGEKLSSFANATVTGWLALLYLSIFGSIVGYSAYVWLIANAPVSLTATYAYVNPVVAVFLGVVFIHEKFHISELLGGLVVLLGVILVVSVEGRRKQTTQVQPLENL